MEIKRLSLQEIEMAKLNGTKINAALETASGNKEIDLQDSAVAIDSQSTEQFEAVKKTVADAVRPGGPELIEKIKARLGDFDKLDSKTLANSMFEDGFDENFFNN